MLYKNLPRAVGLRRITLHKSVSNEQEVVYLLLVECTHFMDHIGEAANLLPILRARICGYTGIFRVAESFWPGRPLTQRANEFYHHRQAQTPSHHDNPASEANEVNHTDTSIQNKPESKLLGAAGFFASFFKSWICGKHFKNCTIKVTGILFLYGQKHDLFILTMQMRFKPKFPQLNA